MAGADFPNTLDQLLGVPVIEVDGIALKRRVTLNFSGVTGDDDPVNKRTNIAFVATEALGKFYDQIRASIDTATVGSIVTAKGNAALADGAGGQWVIDDSGTFTDDGGTILTPGGIGTSHTKAARRIYSGPLNVKWFGAKGDGSTDDTNAIQLTISALVNRNGGAVYFPRGVYITTGIDTAAGGTATNVVFEGDSSSEPGLADSGSIIRAQGFQPYLWKSRGRSLVYKNLTFDGNFAASDVLFFDYQTFGCTVDQCFITRALEFAPVAISSVDTGTNTITATGHGLMNGDRVHIDSSGGSVPSGCFAVQPDTFGWIFFVVGATSDTFQLSLTSGGSVHALGSTGSGSLTVTKLGGTLLRCGGPSNLQVDTCSVHNTVIIQDRASNDQAAIGIRLSGSNTLQWRFINVHVQNAFDMVYADGGGGYFDTCTFFGRPGLSRACFSKIGPSSPVSITNCYTEVAELPIIVCVSQDVADTYDAEPWEVTHNQWNTADCAITWDCKQPLLLRNNCLGGNVRITAVGNRYVVSDGDTFQNGETATMDFKGDLLRLFRRGTMRQSELVPQGTTDPDLFVSIKAFGAKGDGLTDDTAAIQAVIDAAAAITDNVMITVPCGHDTEFRLTAPLTVPAGVKKFALLGERTHSAPGDTPGPSLFYVKEVTGYFIDPTAAYGPGDGIVSLSVEGIELDGANGSTSTSDYSTTFLGCTTPPSSGNYLPNVNYRNVKVRHTKGANAQAFSLQNVFFAELDKAVAWDIVNGWGIYCVGVGVESTTLTIRKSYLHGCRESLVCYANVSDLNVYDTVFESSRVALVAYDTSLTVHGCYFEDIGAAPSGASSSASLSKVGVSISDLTMDIDTGINVRHGTNHFTGCFFNGLSSGGLATAWFRGVGLAQSLGSAGTAWFVSCRATPATDRFISDDTSPVSRFPFIIEVDDEIGVGAKGSLQPGGVIMQYADSRLIDRGRILLPFTGGANFRCLKVEGGKFIYGTDFEADVYNTGSTAPPLEAPDGGINIAGDTCRADSGKSLYTCVVTGSPGTWTGQVHYHTSTSDGLELKQDLIVDGKTLLGSSASPPADPTNAAISDLAIDSSFPSGRPGTWFVLEPNSSNWYVNEGLGNLLTRTGYGGLWRFDFTVGDWIGYSSVSGSAGTGGTLIEKLRLKQNGDLLTVVGGIETNTTIKVGSDLQVLGVAHFGTTKVPATGILFLDTGTATNQGARFVGYTDANQSGFAANYDPATGKNAYAGGSGFARFDIQAASTGGDFVIFTAPNTAEGTVITLTERFRVKCGGTVNIPGLGTGLVHAGSSGDLTSSTLVNADVNASAAIDGTKISPAFGSQNITCTGNITGTSCTLSVTNATVTALSTAGFVTNTSGGVLGTRLLPVAACVVQTTDISYGTATFADMGAMTLTFTAQANSNCCVIFTASVINDNAVGYDNFRILLDGSTITGSNRGVYAYSTAVGVVTMAIMVFTGTLSAGSHTVKVQWHPTAGTAFCRPVANPEQEGASLSIQEILT